jgi:hypothetical protein
MNCLVDAAWSPDGSRIALLGDQHAAYCPAITNGHKSGLVTVFDPTSGMLLSTLHPDDPIVRAIAVFARRVRAALLPAAPQIAAAITYQKILWSPDGRRLALTFSLDPSSIQLSSQLASGEPEILVGVLLLETNGTDPQVLLQAQVGYAPAAVEWDLRTGTSSSPPATLYPAFGALLPALGYRWQNGATPVLVTPLSAAVPPPLHTLGPVGNPAGGSSFTIWQPGVVTGVISPGATGRLSPLPGIYELRSTFAVWSPDGRYLIDLVIPDALLELPSAPVPTADQRSASGIEGMPLLPLHDAGLGRVLRAVNPLNPLGTLIAWRPDGRALAVYAPENVFDVPAVTIDDCATGRQLSSVLPPTQADGTGTSAAALLGQVTLLLWSPDGRHLLLYALPLGQVVLFGPQQLAP